MPRITKSELDKLLSRKGYGISANLGKGSIGSQVGCSGKIDHLESDTRDAQVGPEAVQIGCAGKIRVRLTFYRYRLADYARAISEKALVDCLAYSGLISGDSEKEIWLEECPQVKVDRVEDERTEIEISYPDVDLDNLWQPRKRKDGR